MHFCCNLGFSLRLISHFYQFYKRYLLSKQNFITSLCAVFKLLKYRIDTLLNYNESPFIRLFSYKVDSYIFSSVMALFMTINFLLFGFKFLLFSLKTPVSHKRYFFSFEPVFVVESSFQICHCSSATLFYNFSFNLILLDRIRLQYS